MGPKAIDRMLALEPPKVALDNLQAVWEDFRWRRLKRGHRDPTIKYTALSPDIKTAIKRACDSRGEDGKLFFHQGRVWQVNRDQFAKNLLKYKKALRKSKSFDELWLNVSLIGDNTHGIGAITSYDVTSRIAAYLGLICENYIYTHGGVVDGLRSVGVDIRGRAAIPRDELPPPLDGIKNLDWVEDFLCGYRVLIERALNGD